MTSAAIVNKVWNFCHTLRDDGVGYGAYLATSDIGTLVEWCGASLLTFGELGSGLIVVPPLATAC